jgi:hypothetical protein
MYCHYLFSFIYPQKPAVGLPLSTGIKKRPGRHNSKSLPGPLRNEKSKYFSIFRAYTLTGMLTASRQHINNEQNKKFLLREEFLPYQLIDGV